MAVERDTKDWTWVLERPCNECGFDGADYARQDLSTHIRANAREWQSELSRDDVRIRPNEGRWSVLEYACHARDVYRIFLERLILMETEVDPLFANWDQDEAAINDHYELQDPQIVARELATAAEILAQRLDDVDEDEWSRSGTRSNGSRFTIETLGIYLLHDSLHHLWDVTAL